MIDETLSIDELLLRLPGIDEVQARRIAGGVAAQVARSLGRTTVHPLPAGSALSVRIPIGVPYDELAETIAARILEALR